MTKELETIMDFLNTNRIQILSTIDDNQPISRPIGSAMLFKDRIFFCMNNDKPMYSQLERNPRVCICVCASDFSWIRIMARVNFIDDKEAKAIYIKRPTSSFKSVDDPRLSVFYLSDITAQIYIKGKLNEIKVP